MRPPHWNERLKVVEISDHVIAACLALRAKVPV